MALDHYLRDRHQLDNRAIERTGNWPIHMVLDASSKATIRDSITTLAILVLYMIELRPVVTINRS